MTSEVAAKLYTKTSVVVNTQLYTFLLVLGPGNCWNYRNVQWTQMRNTLDWRGERMKIQNRGLREKATLSRDKDDTWPLLCLQASTLGWTIITLLMWKQVNQTGWQHSPGGPRCRLDGHALGPNQAAERVGHVKVPPGEQAKGCDASVGLLIYQSTALLISSIGTYKSITPVPHCGYQTVEYSWNAVLFLLRFRRAPNNFMEPFYRMTNRVIY